jgi:hypothetical protein
MNTAAKFFDTLTEREIRRRQTLCEKQLAIAVQANNERGIANLRQMENDLMEAMLRRC